MQKYLISILSFSFALLACLNTHAQLNTMQGIAAAALNSGPNEKVLMLKNETGVVIQKVEITTEHDAVLYSNASFNCPATPDKCPAMLGNIQTAEPLVVKMYDAQNKLISAYPLSADRFKLKFINVWANDNMFGVYLFQKMTTGESQNAKLKNFTQLSQFFRTSRSGMSESEEAKIFGETFQDFGSYYRVLANKQQMNQSSFYTKVKTDLNKKTVLKPSMKSQLFAVPGRKNNVLPIKKQTLSTGSHLQANLPIPQMPAIPQYIQRTFSFVGGIGPLMSLGIGLTGFIQGQFEETGGLIIEKLDAIDKKINDMQNELHAFHYRFDEILTAIHQSEFYGAIKDVTEKLDALRPDNNEYVGYLTLYHAQTLGEVLASNNTTIDAVLTGSGPQLAGMKGFLTGIRDQAAHWTAIANPEYPTFKTLADKATALCSKDSIADGDMILRRDQCNFVMFHLLANLEEEMVTAYVRFVDIINLFHNANSNNLPAPNMTIGNRTVYWGNLETSSQQMQDSLNDFQNQIIKDRVLNLQGTTDETKYAKTFFHPLVDLPPLPVSPDPNLPGGFQAALKDESLKCLQFDNSDICNADFPDDLRSGLSSVVLQWFKNNPFMSGGPYVRVQCENGDLGYYDVPQLASSFYYLKNGNNPVNRFGTLVPPPNDDFKKYYYRTAGLTLLQQDFDWELRDKWIYIQLNHLGLNIKFKFDENYPGSEKFAASQERALPLTMSKHMYAFRYDTDQLGTSDISDYKDWPIPGSGVTYEALSRASPTALNYKSKFYPYEMQDMRHARWINAELNDVITISAKGRDNNWYTFAVKIANYRTVRRLSDVNIEEDIFVYAGLLCLEAKKENDQDPTRICQSEFTNDSSKVTFPNGVTFQLDTGGVNVKDPPLVDFAPPNSAKLYLCELENGRNQCPTS